MPKETYSDKLRDRRWQKKRNSILERDGYKCQNPNCISETNSLLEVHHLIYLGTDPWDMPDDLLITLCSSCHGQEKGREKLESHLANTLKMKGFLVSDLLAMSCKMETDNTFTKSILNILRQFQKQNHG